MTNTSNLVARFGMHGFWVGFLGSALLSWQLTAAHYQNRISELQRGQTELIAHARKADLQTLQLANARADQLTTRLVTTQAQLDTTEREKAHALRQITTGRLCLDAGVVRVLNSPNTTAHGTAGVPTSASGAAAAGAAAAAAGTEPLAEPVTDTDVSLWVVDAKRRHEACRARLDALIDYHLTPPQ